MRASYQRIPCEDKTPTSCDSAVHDSMPQHFFIVVVVAIIIIIIEICRSVCHIVLLALKSGWVSL